jgi:hypothetical protein
LQDADLVAQRKNLQLKHSTVFDVNYFFASRDLIV